MRQAPLLVPPQKRKRQGQRIKRDRQERHREIRTHGPVTCRDQKS